MANIGIAQSQITGRGGSGSSSSTNRYLSVKDHGAIGSGKITFVVTMPIGTPNLNATDPVFSAGDAGKNIVVAGAGANGTDLWTTILTFTDANNVVLSANAITDVNPATSAAPNLAAWGAVDDTAAIQATITAASAAGLGVYIPTGVYITSATLTVAAPVPLFIFGDGNDNSYLLAQNPGISPYVQMIDFETNGQVMGVNNFSCVGGSYNHTVGPTAGNLVTIYTLSTTVDSIAVFNSSFLVGLNIQNSFGIIQACFDVAQSTYKLDSTAAIGCEAAGFVVGGDVGAEGGVMDSCIGVGDWPITYCFDFNPTGLSGQPVSVLFLNCGASGGALGTVVPVGFHVFDACMAQNCNTEFLQVSFLIGLDGMALHCQGIEGNTLADYVVSNGELPYKALQKYFLGQLIIDTNGNYQQITTAGTTGASAPVWSTVGTTADGSAVWTKIANPGFTTVTGAAIENCENTLSAATYALYDLGTRTTLKQNKFVGRITSTNPAQVVVSGIQTVTVNYTTANGDDMINANADGVVITLGTTNQLQGKSQTVKNITATGSIRVIGQTGNIDGLPYIDMQLSMMSMDFKWDGTNFWIH